VNQVRVIGVGSPVANDQLGWQAINVLEQAQVLNKIPEQIDLCCSDRPGAGLLSLFENFSCVLLIDAIASSENSDGVLRLEKEDLLLNPTTVSSHAFGVAEALTLGDKLGLLPEKIILYGYAANGTGLFSQQQVQQLASVLIEELQTLQ